MALKPCRECGEKVSSEAQVCPRCGIGAPTGAQIPPKEQPSKQGSSGCLVPLIPITFVFLAMLYQSVSKISIGNSIEPFLNDIQQALAQADPIPLQVGTDIVAEKGAPACATNDALSAVEKMISQPANAPNPSVADEIQTLQEIGSCVRLPAGTTGTIMDSSSIYQSYQISVTSPVYQTAVVWLPANSVAADSVRARENGSP